MRRIFVGECLLIINQLDFTRLGFLLNEAPEGFRGKNKKTEIENKNLVVF
jgi:hypothetical protein